MFERLTDNVATGIENAAAALSGALLEPKLRLGVTGLSRAGKTIFITALVANLLNRARMPQFRAASRITAAWLQPQPDPTVPRFPYEDHIARLTGPQPAWPDRTRSISELRLSLRVASGGMLAGLRGVRTVHLDIVDYPGEWLLDLPLMARSYADWAGDALARAKSRPGGAEYLAAAAATDPAATFDEMTARALAAAYSAYLRRAAEAGYADISPGRFLQPGDLDGSPALTFAPLTMPERPRRDSLWLEMRRRYDAYRQRVARPFFHEHLNRIDRQVVLVDVLAALASGPQALNGLQQTLAAVLTAFRPGRNDYLRGLLLGRRVERILFAATKADHLHHLQHDRLAGMMTAMVDEARRRAEFRGARTRAMAIAAVRTTTEATRQHDGRSLAMVRGTLCDGRETAFHPGDLPEDPGRLLAAARTGAMEWPDFEFGQACFRPITAGMRPGEGLPHIRLDRAADFLLGDAL